MDHQRWRMVDRLFQEAAALGAPARAAYLREAGVDAGTAREVHRLLLMHDRAGDFLEIADLQSSSDSPGDEQAQAFRPGDLIDRFRLVRSLGSGGMGEVWLAERADRAFEQRVALKIVRGGRASPQAMRRFLDERQLLARLEHPFITRLIDGGTTEDGRPYLAMEVVEGAPIDGYCRDQRLGIRDRLRLFRSVCEAVQYAHQNLIVHRDLKPANVLVTGEGHPKLLDFGIAGLLAATEGVIGMTPLYASPEQLRGAPCTTAGDVYSLGVLLRELAAPEASMPTRGAVTAFAEAAQEAVSAWQSPLPRALGDLRFVIGKALQAAPERRYSTARELADDVERYLLGRPVRARSATAGYRAARFVRRNMAGCVVGLLAVVGLTIAAVVAVRSWGQAGRDRDIAQAANAFLESVLGSASPFALGMNPTVEDLLARTSERAGTELADRPEVEFRARMTLVRAHISLWNWVQVREEASRALALSRRLYGPDSAETATCLTALGRSQTWGRDSVAIDTQRQALEVRSRLFPPDHPAIAEVYINLGFAYWMTAKPPRLDDAESYYRKGIAAFQAGGSTDLADYARALFSFANFLRSRYGNTPESLELVRESVERFEQLRQPPDRYSTAALFMLGRLLIDRGEYAAGELRLLQFVDQVPEELAGEIPLHHAQWLIALVRRAGGVGEEVEAAFRRAFVLECRARIRTTSNTEPWSTLAAKERDAGEFRTLVSVLLDTVSALERSKDQADAELLERLTAFAALTDDPADVPIARRLVESARDMLISRFPMRHCAPACCDAALGHLLNVEGQTVEAEVPLSRAFAALREDRGLFDPFAQLALVPLIRTAEARGATEKAAKLRTLRAETESVGVH